ncbi:hypothetical protein MWN41_03515 [Ornithobacterium rhinotracheale]|uniref:hypothetical protein n=1 Tax=Ornithobacterium rhinotracheale TaxID=28251 RepID=UPI001FF2C2FC|nr:hypothetical protein [Ornithobacterium rhinotracheale]MCK0202086.1 hypothetical protein [Ornithobacterium rhinotracheale]
MKKSLIISFFKSLFIFFSCNKKDVSAANTQSIVEEYLENNPHMKRAGFRPKI